MALVINLKCVENLFGKSDRIARVRFRGTVNQSKIVHNAKRVAYFGETFEWPIARDATGEESVEIVVVNYNKYLANKVVGIYQLLLQKVIEDGEIQINEPLVDQNNRILETTISFDVHYYSPDGKVGNWGQEEFTYPLTDDFDSQSVLEWDQQSNGSRRGMPKALGETHTLRGRQDGPDGDMQSMLGDNLLPGEDTASQTMLIEKMFSDAKRRPDMMEQELHRARDFQVCVRVLEGQQLAGLDIDPVIRIDVGELHRYSSIKQSTNCPFYDEYFVFDFKESLYTMLDTMITITAYHAYGIPGRQVLKAGNIIAGKRTIGVFKCDVGTVFSSPNRQYWHKWAVLLDPKDTSEGPKGFVKCDIAIVGKGDVIKAPKGVKDSETTTIEGNLLLPVGVPMERQQAVYQVTIYRAEYLPRTNLGIMASVRKTLNMNNVALVDALVKVTFAGHTGKTSVRRSHHPEWKEVLSFIDHFPPLCNRIKVQLCDSETVSDPSIATHFLELAQIMDPGGDADGILPSFGPSWLNFYGAPRNYKFLAEHEDLNEGEGEGAAFRGRLLISISTKLMDDEVKGAVGVKKDKLMRTGGWMDNQPRKEFMLYGTIFEASMIDKELRDKPIYFELSIGQYGNKLDGQEKLGGSEVVDDGNEDSDSDEDEGTDPRSHLIQKRKEEERALWCHSQTEPQNAKCDERTKNSRNYYYMPYDSVKPCLYVCSLFEDLRKRLYHTNLLEKIADELDGGLEDVKHMLRSEHPDSARRLRGAMQVLEQHCEEYLLLSNSPVVKAGQGGTRTNLDKYRLKAVRTKIDKLKSFANTTRRTVTMETVQACYRAARNEARRLRFTSKDPQHALPDVFIWMICDKKRIAYYRFPAKDLIWANADDFMGKSCGKKQTVFLRKPGKKGTGQSGWAMQARLEVALWLGERQNKSNVFLEKMPNGYTPEYGDQPNSPPTTLRYDEVHTFQLRAYLFQCRSLIGCDDTGLSDPFARVIIGRKCQVTQVVNETLSPMWNETLEFNDIKIYGPLVDLLRNPPYIIIEIYDYDTVGAPEFLGRAIVKPKVKTKDMAYTWPDWPPQLEWFDVYRGPRTAGEMLASFELLEGDLEDLPLLPPSRSGATGPIMSIPLTIKPTLCKYRIEVMFWGLRELNKVQLLSVDRPRVTAECCGTVLECPRIENMDKNCNFESPLLYMDVDLPENEEFWPPLTIRVEDCRKFGRNVLVGTCTINHLTKYKWLTREERQRLAEEAKNKRNKLKSNGDVITKGDGTPAVEISETLPPEKDVVINMPTVGALLMGGPEFGPAPSHVSINMDTTLSRNATPVPSVQIIQPDAGSVQSGQAGAMSIRSGQPGTLTVRDARMARAQSLQSGQAGDMSVHSGQTGAFSIDGVHPEAMSLQRGQLGAMSIHSGQPGAMSLKSGQLGAMSIHSGQPDAMSIQSGQPGAMSLQSGQPGVMSIHSGQPDAMSLQSGQPGAMSIHSGQPGAMSLQSGQPGAMSIHSGQPGAMSIHSGQPGAMSIHSGQPGAMSIHSGQPGAMSIHSGQPGAMSIHSGQPGAMSIHSGQPGAQSIHGSQLRAPGVQGDVQGALSLYSGRVGGGNTQAVAASVRSDQIGSARGSVAAAYHAQQGQLQPGPIPPGQMPPGMMPNGQMPPGMMPNGQMPPGMMPNGQMPNGELPNGETPPGGPPPDVPPSKKPPAPAEGKKKMKMKDLISDLDWWSKYYVTTEDIERKYYEEEVKAQEKGTDAPAVDISSDEDDVHGIDYGALDQGKLTQLKDIAKKERLAMEAEKEKKKKKKKKKKKSAKEKLSKLKGKVNKAFEKGEDDNESVLDRDFVEDMEDKSHIARIQLFSHELENVAEFGGFEESIHTFQLLKGKKMDDEEDDSGRYSGKFKGMMCLYKIGVAGEDDASSIISVASKTKSKNTKDPKDKIKLKLHDGMPNHRPFEVKVMVYILKGVDLHPVDLNGKADPYLVIHCGRQETNDKEHKILNQLNPVFGRLFEFDVQFPMDSMLRIEVMDWDALSADDLIGETSFDMENRFFSLHRPRCGLQQQYAEWGYNAWRDPMKPTDILEKMCKDHKLPTPLYKVDSVFVGGRTYYGANEIECEAGGTTQTQEPIALEALKHWDDVVPGSPLVPEHIETRSIFSPEQPGVDQGKLEMWVDMFPKDMTLPSVTVDITPRLPKGYELRIIIWNTDDVVLEDTNMLTGEASSDIFVKAYLKGAGEDDQQTDVHYRSLTGEGNFNWRFLFPFEYLKAEEKVLYKTGEGAFGMSDVEMKVPAKVTLQVWDADIVSADDFLGSIAIDLNRIPRPAKDAKKCSVRMMEKIVAKDGSLPTLNLFKNKRCRGWWPMMAKEKDDDGMKLVGKVEAEFQLLTAEEAERGPAGKGREDPDGLSEPNRPDTSFLWFLNPFRTLYFIIWQNYKWTIIKAFLFALLVAAFALFMYNIPGVTVTKMFG